MPAWTKQHLILYFPELNTRINLFIRNMFQIFILYFLLIQKLAFLPYDFFKSISNTNTDTHFLNLKIQIQILQKCI